MKNSSFRLYTIVVSESRFIKSGRDRFSGIMRYAALHDNWNVRIVSEGAYATSTSDPSPRTIAPDGIIGHDVKREMLSGRRRNIPFVAIDDDPTNGNAFRVDASVLIDDGAIGRAAAGIFLKAGLRNLAFVGVQHRSEAFHQRIRCDAVRECAEKAGATFCAFMPRADKETDFARDIEKLAAWLAKLPVPCGVMAYNDSRAQMVIDACHMMHLKMPDQIQIIGVDNDVEICENMHPTLTSILPDFYGAGYLAAQLLDDILTNGRPRKTRDARYGINSIVVRESTQDLKGGGRLVNLAREFIRLHANERITVKDIAEALNISRRTLEIRFLEITGGGVAEVLRKERLERVRRLLIETNRTISDIAFDSGFDSPTHLAGLFKNTYHMTMGEWRQASRR
ncbi:MAG: substrate-binding domain-containing protein [Kiritimatiellae bacterium]|nr:substrate-binding domain-containing protein [Kiritimatiellia bacterium]